MIYPDEFKLFDVISKNDTYSMLYLYHKSDCIYSGKLKNISPEELERLKNFLQELILINNSKLNIKFGIEEVQNKIEEFK